ncbi:hypothetical protein [Cupriavidus sp. DL-D2]|uniref:hypothetical protein n=1 Tax=Cupriavidus sp. DL-D2 TaxID=3144974 RepID=UPI003215E712
MTNDNDARGALTIREGWKLVPIEPTREMWDAVNKLDDQMAAGGYDGKGCSIEQAWNCLLDHAPAAPKLPAGDGLTDLINAYGRACRRDGSPAWESDEGRALKAVLAAPRQPGEVGSGVQTRDEIEARQRAGLKRRFANRPSSPATADFDLPAPNDPGLDGIDRNYSRTSTSAQQDGPECVRSHPHENMSQACEAKTVEARAVNRAAQQDEREADAWTTEDDLEPISDALKRARPDLYGKKYTVPLVRAAQQVQADAGAVDIDAAERAAFESTNDSDNLAIYKHWFRKGFKAAHPSPAAESDKRDEK